MGMMLMTGFCLVYIGYRLSTKLTLLFQLMQSKSRYQRAKYKSDADTQHVVIGGYVQKSTIETVVNEYFHEDHNDNVNQNRKAVIFQPNDPSTSLEMFLYTPEFQNKLTYVKGNTMNTEDLKRAALAQARCCIILTNKNAKDSIGIDHKNILQGLAMKKHVQDSTGSNLPLVMQLIKAESM